MFSLCLTCSYPKLKGSLEKIVGLIPSADGDTMAKVNPAFTLCRWSPALVCRTPSKEFVYYMYIAEYYEKVDYV